MRLAFVREAAAIICILKSAEEISKASIFLEYLLAEEKAKSKVPPEPKQYLFKNLNTAEKHPHILFGHKDFCFGIRFLEVIAMATVEEGGETKDMEQFLCQLNEYSKTLVPR